MLRNVRALGSMCTKLGACCSTMEIKLNKSVEQQTAAKEKAINPPLTREKDMDDSEIQVQNAFQKYKCTQCTRTFRSDKGHQNHIDSFHKGNKGKHFPCSHCNKTFASENSLKVHTKHHSTGATKMCKVCCRMFVHQSELSQHLLLHCKEKNFLCTTCDKKYTHKYKLNRHMKSCCQKLKCNECDQLICGKKNLKEHIRTKHAKEPLYKCTICDNKPKSGCQVVGRVKKKVGKSRKLCPKVGKK